MYRAIALLLVTTLLLTACSGASGGATASPTATETPTPEQATTPDTPQAFVDALDAAMVREGEVLHMTLTATGAETGKEPEALWTDELWIYATENSARHLFHRAPENSEELADEAILITNDDVTFDDTGGNEIEVYSRPPMRDCPLVETTSMVYATMNLFCVRYAPPPEEVAEFSAEVDPDATFEGRAAIALTYSARNKSASDVTPAPESRPDSIISTFYADRETQLPLGWTVEFYSRPEQLAGTLTGRYTSEFIDRDELAADFFSPVTLIEPEPDVQLYWLGGEFAPNGDLPAIVPHEMTLSTAAAEQPAYQVHLSYGVPFGTDPWINQIEIHQWAQADFEAAQANGLIASDMWLYPCAAAQPVELAGGDATIYLTYEPAPNGPLPGADGDCPDYAPDRFIGIVHLDDTVIVINGPFGNEPHPRSLGADDDPYDSLEGVRAIIAGLQPL